MEAEKHIVGKIMLAKLQQGLREKWNKRVAKQPIIEKEIVILAVSIYIAMMI